MKHLKSYVCILTLLLLITSMSITSCTEDFGPEIDRLKEDLSSLKTSVDKLKEAYEGGKIISGVEPLLTDIRGWKISFSDNTAIILQNGKDGANGADGKDGKDGENGKDGANGVDGKDGKDGINGITPYIKIDNNCNWIVSYDNGQTYSPIVDSEGNSISAKGINGADGVSVEIQVNDNGNYEIITYIEDKNNPITILPTPYSANPDNQISSIVENSEKGIVIITMSSGKQYNFFQALNYPTSIVLLKKEFLISEEGGTAEIEFFVNPSNARITKDDIEINQIEKELLKSYAETYANPSPNYEIVSLENSVNEKGEQLQGRYKLTIKHIGESGLYSELCTLVISTKDAQDNKIEITSEKFILISEIYSLTVQVILPDFINWTDIENASVVAVNKNTQEVLSLSEISEGVYKTIEITEGEYEVCVEMSAFDGFIGGSAIVYVDKAQTAAIEIYREISSNYSSIINIDVVNPEDLTEKEPLGQVESNVDVKIKASTLNLKIVGIDLSSLGVPVFAEPFDVELANVPYTLVDGVYNINYTEKVNLPFASVSAELQYLRGSIQNNTIEMEIFVIGSEDLLYMPVLITVNSK